MDHLALAVSSQARSMRFYERYFGFVAELDWWDEPDYVSVEFRDPDGYVVEVSWEP